MMHTTSSFRVIWAAFSALALLVPTANAIDAVWDGGDGLWTDPNWNGGMPIESILGAQDGADGYNGDNTEEQSIFIGDASTVEYPGNTLDADFEMFQGSNLTIHEGATWLQSANDSWTENRWTEMDLSNLVLDNGSFRRIGSVPSAQEGGGALIFGSWQGDDTFDEPEAPLDHFESNILITNGGLLENEGQLWFGSWDDTPANGTVIRMTINDGMLDLTGGDIVMDEPADADLVFTNPFPPSETENQPTYAINFTGPGSISVDFSGIVNAYRDESGMWLFDYTTYEDLWELGILQAHGESGLDGANFGDFFTVEGELLSLGEYVLTSNVEPMVGEGIPGDYSGNGLVEQADLDLVLGNWGAEAANVPGTWVNDPPEGFVDQAELDKVLGNWGSMAPGLAAAGAVPEPATCVLLLVVAGIAAVALRR